MNALWNKFKVLRFRILVNSVVTEPDNRLLSSIMVFRDFKLLKDGDRVPLRELLDKTKNCKLRSELSWEGIEPLRLLFDRTRARRPWHSPS